MAFAPLENVGTGPDRTWTSFLVMLSPDTFALTALLALLTALGPLAMDLYLPSLPAIATALAAPLAHVQLTISSYLIGFAGGQIIYGPLSDRYGRKPVLKVALAIFCVGTLATFAAPTIDALIAARAVQGAGAAGALVLVRAIVRDLYEGPRAGRELSLMGSIMGVAPIVAPVVGGVTQTALGWRFGFLLIFVAGIAAIVAVWRLLPETGRSEEARGLSMSALLRSYVAIMGNRSFLAHLAIATTTYAGLFAYISGSPFVLQGLYGLSPLGFGLFYGVTSFGFIIGTLIASHLVIRRGFDGTIGLGAVALAVGGLLLTLSTAMAPGMAVAVAAPMMVYCAGIGLALPLSLAGALQPFPDRAGAASSLVGSVQQVVGASVGAVVGHALGATAWPMVIGIAATGFLTLLVWALTRKARARAFRPKA
jgi:DHA1 family bicyclomycin/chloramphenicol resistance-like MFS transporter